MPKIVCKCGHVIEDISIPNPNGRLLVSEEALDKIESSADIIEGVAKIFDDITAAGARVFVCPTCSRLMVFLNGNSEEPILYKFDE